MLVFLRGDGVLKRWEPAQFEAYILGSGFKCWEPISHEFFQWPHG